MLIKMIKTIDKQLKRDTYTKKVRMVNVTGFDV